MGCPSPMRPKYIAGPIRSLLKAKFIPHIGNKVPCRMTVPHNCDLSCTWRLESVSLEEGKLIYTKKSNRMDSKEKVHMHEKPSL